MKKVVDYEAKIETLHQKITQQIAEWEKLDDKYDTEVLNHYIKNIDRLRSQIDKLKVQRTFPRWI